MSAYTPEEQWNAYLLAFNSDRPDEREQLLEQSVSTDVVFTNPAGGGRTRSALSAHIAQFREKMPGMYFTTDKVMISDRELLSVWSMYKPDSTKVSTGYNFVRIDQAGRLEYLAGFF